MDSSVQPDTFEMLSQMRASIQNNMCANCLVFAWKQVEPESLQSCGRCKILKYCSKECQVEHYPLPEDGLCQAVGGHSWNLLTASLP